jgi:hypothetical protein
VSLPVSSWLALVVLLWVGTIPFAALGVAFGYLLDGETAQIATMIVYFVMAILGGFWAPIDQFRPACGRWGRRCRPSGTATSAGAWWTGTPRTCGTP